MKVAILTVSDATHRGEREDVSGASIVTWCEERGYEVLAHEVVPDETSAITPWLVHWADAGGAQLILTTGGTGLTERDVTPEATLAAIDRSAPGISEEIRRQGLEATPYAVLSRGVTGTRGRTLIVNFPGSPGGVKDGLSVLSPIVEHAVGLLHDPRSPHTPAGS